MPKLYPPYKRIKILATYNFWCNPPHLNGTSMMLQCLHIIISPITGVFSQEDYLSGKALYFRKWKAPKKEWDHDHCAFCWETFSDYPDTLHEGYTTEDNYYWICPTCYNDFKEMFKWKENDRQ